MAPDFVQKGYENLSGDSRKQSFLRVAKQRGVAKDLMRIKV